MDPFGGLNAAVLVGGSSRRMGRPKQTLTRDGRTLAEIAVAAVAECVRKVVIVGSGPISENLHVLDRVMDPPGIDGPIAGVLAAMRWCPESAWIVAACDMPLMEAPAVQWLVSQRRTGTWAILPRTAESRIEPLFAVYEPQMHDVLESRVAQGRLGFQYLAGHGMVRCPTPPDEIRDAWINVNTMEEFQRSSVLDV